MFVLALDVRCNDAQFNGDYVCALYFSLIICTLISISLV